MAFAQASLSGSAAMPLRIMASPRVTTGPCAAPARDGGADGTEDGRDCDATRGTDGDFVGSGVGTVAVKAGVSVVFWCVGGIVSVRKLVGG